jgi:hypothetical protein
MEEREMSSPYEAIVLAAARWAADMYAATFYSWYPEAARAFDAKSAFDEAWNAYHIAATVGIVPLEWVGRSRRIMAASAQRVAELDAYRG